MKKDKKSVSLIIFGIFLIALVCYTCLTFETFSKDIHRYYQVYLGGEKIGLISSKDALYKKINKEQEAIKKQYGVEEVHEPHSLSILAVDTYKTNLVSVNKIYEDIKDLDPFTIEGYEVTIKKNDKVTKFYVLHKEDLDVAVRNTILSFVDEKQYDAYLNGTQEEVTDVGIEITNIYFDSSVSIKKTYISTEEKIFTDSEELSKYFMFGSTEPAKIYKVNEYDTMETIADRNEMSVFDVLVANPNIKSENVLLALGQEINVSPVLPLSNIVVESFQTEYQTISFNTQIVFDNTMDADQMYVKQQGINGISKVTYAQKEMNGVILAATLVNSEVVKETQDKIVVYGSRNVVYYGNTTYWAWPTKKPFRISSNYGWRVDPVYGGGEKHGGIDITGVPSREIYAVQSGTVTLSRYNSSAGNEIRIDHGNGYVSGYMHLKEMWVHVGETVSKGQQIAVMGSTGKSTGTHLDFRIYVNGSTINPLSIYQ